MWRRVGGDWDGNKLLTEAVCHTLCYHVVHLLGVLGRVVIVRSMRAGCGLSFLFGVGALVAIVGAWYTCFCVGTLATSWGSSCSAVFSVCTVWDWLRSRMRLLWAYLSTVGAGVSSLTTLGNFCLGGCCVTLGGGCCTWGFTF